MPQRDLRSAIAEVCPPGAVIEWYEDPLSMDAVIKVKVKHNCLDLGPSRFSGVGPAVTIPAGEGPDKDTFHDNIEETPDTLEDLALSLSLTRQDIVALARHRGEIDEDLAEHEEQIQNLVTRVSKLENLVSLDDRRISNAHTRIDKIRDQLGTPLIDYLTEKFTARGVGE